MGLSNQVHAFPFLKTRQAKPDYNKGLAFQISQLGHRYVGELKYTPNFDHFNYFNLPDYDQDGIPDKYDNCPSVVGVPERFGCPTIDITKLITFARPTIAIPEDEFEASVEAFANLEFVNGRLTISSAKELEAFVKILKRKRKWIISLSSYVDLGSETDNVEVSKERLKQLRAYMIKKGISMKRIKGEAFGDTMPVVDLPLSRFEVEINY